MSNRALIYALMVISSLYCLAPKAAIAGPSALAGVAAFFFIWFVVAPICVCGVWIALTYYHYKKNTPSTTAFFSLLDFGLIVFIFVALTGVGGSSNGIVSVWQPMINGEDIYYYGRVFIFCILFFSTLYFLNRLGASNEGAEGAMHFIICFFMFIVFLIISYPSASGPVSRWLVDWDKLKTTGYYALQNNWEIAHQDVYVEGAQEIETVVGKMILVKPGTFIMGSPEDEEGRGNDEKQHQITLSKGFYIQNMEITRGQWNRVMSRRGGCKDSPKIGVSWEDAQEFVLRLNKLKKTDKYRLPTEAEWEYACRAGSNEPFSSGNCLSQEHGIYDGTQPEPGCQESKKQSDSAFGGSTKPNALGIYDMHGNLQEWVQDVYDKYPDGEVVDPTGPETGKFRVTRGGGWDSPAKDCRSAARKAHRPYHKISNPGFRVVRDL